MAMVKVIPVQCKASTLKVSKVLNDPTEFEQTVVSCSDWVGSFFAVSPFVSRVTGFFSFGCHMTQTNQNQSAKRVDGGIRTPTDIIHVSLGLAVQGCIICLI